MQNAKNWKELLMANNSMAESSARKDKLKQLIDNLSDQQADALSDQLVNSQEEEHPGTYKFFGDADPAGIELGESVTAPGIKGHAGIETHRSSMLNAQAWAQKVVEVARLHNRSDPNKVWYGNKLYDMEITPAVPAVPANKRKKTPGSPAVPEQIDVVENVF